eukprot:403348002
MDGEKQVQEQATIEQKIVFESPSLELNSDNIQELSQLLKTSGQINNEQIPQEQPFQQQPSLQQQHHQIEQIAQQNQIQLPLEKQNLPATPQNPQNFQQNSQQKQKNGVNEDKLQSLLNKWQEESRDKVRQQASERYDILNNSPEVIIQNIKEDSQDFVQAEWTFSSQWNKSKNIFRQFYSRINPHNSLFKNQPTFMVKTRRIQYVFEKYRQIQSEKQPSTLREIADIQLVNEIKFWATKYLILSYVAGINISYFAYHMGLKKLKLYVGLPLTFVVFFESRNIFMKNFMDKIYFPIEPIYNQLREDEKYAKSSKVMNSQTVRGGTIVDDLKEEIFNEARIIQNKETLVKQELEDERVSAEDRFNSIINQLHDQYVNESDFTTGKEGYKKFVDNYISLYYIPLVEEYDEARYFTQEFDRSFLKKQKYRRSKRLVSVELTK